LKKDKDLKRKIGMKRLTERDWKDKSNEGYPWHVHPVKSVHDLPYYKKLAVYEDEEERGLLLRLPCKAGDTVYHVVGRSILEVEKRRYYSCFRKNWRRCRGYSESCNRTYPCPQRR